MFLSVILQVLIVHIFLYAPGNELQAAVTSPWSFEAVGCFKDNHGSQRPLPRLLVNLREHIDWNNLNRTIYECARTAVRHHYRYFGVQFWGECWSGVNAERTYFVDGESTHCYGGVGKDFANFVYRFTDSVENPTTDEPILIGTRSTALPMTTRPTAPTISPSESSHCSSSDGFVSGCECKQYEVIFSPRRSRFTLGGVAECDNHLVEKWYRFTGEAGDRMPNKCVSRRRCGTFAPGWLRGAHPSVEEGAVRRTVCFSWQVRCCYWQQEVLVRNCGAYYVYRLGPPPTCNLRYCGNGISMTR